MDNQAGLIAKDASETECQEVTDASKDMIRVSSQYLDPWIADIPQRRCVFSATTPTYRLRSLDVFTQTMCIFLLALVLLLPLPPPADRCELSVIDHYHLRSELTTGLACRKQRSTPVEKKTADQGPQRRSCRHWAPGSGIRSRLPKTWPWVRNSCIQAQFYVGARGHCPQISALPQIFWLQQLRISIQVQKWALHGLQNTPKCIFSRGSAPDPTVGAHGTSPAPQLAGEVTWLPKPHLTRRLRRLDSPAFGARQSVPRFRGGARHCPKIVFLEPRLVLLTVPDNERYFQFLKGSQTKLA